MGLLNMVGAERKKILEITLKPHTWANVALDVVTELEGRGLYSPDLKYRNFARNRLRKVRKTGTDRDKNSRMWELFSDERPEDVLWADDEDHKLVTGGWHQPGEGDVWTMAVYDGAKLTYIDTHRKCAYRRNGEFPIAIFTIDLNHLNHQDLEAYKKARRAYLDFQKSHSKTKSGWKFWRRAENG